MRGCWSAGALALGLVLSACGPQAATPEAGAAPAQDARSAAGAGSPASATAAETPKLGGRPLWSSTRSQTAEENAREAFARNGEAFGAASFEDFVQTVHDFTGDPPSGTQRITRNNGDVLLYHPKTNVFAVVTREGAPRTMFKPDDGPAYWEEQKAREAARKTKE